MPDVWATVTELDSSMQERLAGVLETRAADPQQQEMRRAFLADLELPAQARVLEVGCGTGVLTRALARMPDIDAVVGVDVAASLLDKARALAADPEPRPRGPKTRSPRRSACCARLAGSRLSTAITRPRRWR